MKKPSFLSAIFLTAALFLSTIEGLKAQFTQLPVDQSGNERRVEGKRLRVDAAPLSLPFWDDFSSGAIDSLKWQNAGVVASYTIGIDPPSIGVAYLDGVDIKGKPYATAMLGNGEADQLISRAIDLSTFATADSLYLSFFWQAGGKGETPDDNDKLELYFLNKVGEWVLVWETFGGDSGKRTTFTQEMIKVKADFYHPGFSFKFLNKGRLSGPFDSWIIDYVYLNKERNVYDIYYEDRALTSFPSSPLGKYNALPLFEWEKTKKENVSAIHSQFKNLSNRFRAMEYTVQLRDRTSGAVLQNLHVQTPFNPVPQALERRDFSSVNPKELSFNVSKEFDLETLVFLTTGDEPTDKKSSVDFRVNDTLRHILPLRDFMAYDNGSLDYAAGINQRSGMLALRYEVKNPAYLKGISLNFANLSQVGSALELMVWKDLDAAPVYGQEILIPNKERLNEFSYFEIDTNLNVADTFYIGFKQFTNDFIYVGLDKSSDSGQEVFFNVTGSWEQNDTVQGSLMMRPHLSLSPAAEKDQADARTSLLAYPNPVSEKLFLEGSVDEIKVFDSYGRQINIPVESFEKGKILNFTGSDKGVYVVRAWTGNKSNSIRILVK